MKNRVYKDLKKLRTDVERLIDDGRVLVIQHARLSHPELEPDDQIAIVRFGGTIKQDQKRDPSEGVYLCWATLPGLGICRAVFCVQETQQGPIVKIITGFQD
jgi:hypothetical protein